MTPYIPWPSQPAHFPASPPPLQLRLTIQRPSLPDLKLWHDVPRSPPTTIAQLLAALNADIPLEADDLGLEDYVVFGGEYELLHFKIVANIMREDVLYVVRPLSLDERKARRDGGRERVDSGGARLYDGVAFGRTKRKRIGRKSEPARTQEQEQGEGETGGQLKGVLRTNGVAKKRSGSVSFVEEERHTRQELAESDENETSDEEDSDYDADELDESLDDDEYADLVQDADDDDNDIQTTGRLRSGKQLVLKDSSVPKGDEEERTPATKTKRKQVSSDSDSSDSSDDSDNFDSSDSAPETISSKKRKLNATRPNDLAKNVSTEKSSDFKSASQQSQKPPASSESHSDSSSSISSSSDSSDSTSSFDSSSAESAKKNVKQAKKPANQQFNGTNATKKTAKQMTQPAKQQVNCSSTSQRSNTSSEGSTPAPKEKQKQSAPGQGREGTKARNQRKKYQRALKARQAKGLEPMEMTVNEYKAKCIAETAEAAAKPAESAAGPTALEQRRQLLLERIAEGGVDVAMSLDVETVKPADEVQLATELVDTAEQSEVLSHPLVDTEMTDNQPELATQLEAAAQLEILSQLEAAAQVPQLDGTSASKAQSPASAATPSQVEDQVSQRRSKTLDVASTRRLLFGSLGVRAPKTKVDEERVRSRLASLGNRTSVNAPNSGKGAAATAKKLVSTAENTNLDAWKSKIKLTAVECVNEDVGLSTPPFPFVQRWDVSQQLPKGKKRKRKSNAAAAYEQETEVDESLIRFDDSNVQLDYDEKPDENDQHEDKLQANAVSQPSTITTHLTPDTNGAYTQQWFDDNDVSEDLPELPADITTLPALELSQIVLGSVIAFRQLSEPTAATNWQPIVSGYMTAVIISLEGETGQLSHSTDVDLRLAWRDREENERYDENGERIYSKFEMQLDDYDSPDDRWERGVIHHSFADLSSYGAKLLVAAPADDGNKYWRLVAPPDRDPDEDEEPRKDIASTEFQDKAERDSTISSMPPTTNPVPPQSLQTTSQNFVTSTEDSGAKSDVEWEDEEEEQDEDKHEAVNSTVLVRDSQIAQPDSRKLSRYRVRQDAEYEKVASQLSLAAILAKQKG